MIPLIVPESVWFVLKLLTLLGLLIYAIFAVIIVRQEQLMANVLEESFEPVLRLLSFIHLLVSLAILLLAIVIL